MTINDGYSIHRGEEVDAWLSSQPLKIQQAVWVCKSKGLKKRRGKQQRQQQQEKKQAGGGGDNESAGGGEQNLQPFLRARILSLNDDALREGSGVEKEEDGKDPRITVIYPKGSTYRVRKSHLWPILTPSSSSNNDGGGGFGQVLVWPETDVYRRCCIQHTDVAQDYFVEVGCDYGTTVAKVASTSSSPSSALTDADHTRDHHSSHRTALGIDKSTESIAIAKSRYPNLPFIQWDILEEEEPASLQLPERQLVKESDDDATGVSSSMLHIWDYLLAQQHNNERSSCSDNDNDSDTNDVERRPFSPLVVAIDINGNRELEAVQSCVARVKALWRPRLIIVKSRALYHKIHTTT
mmetsp:Transcript_10046/g.13275  ORF Transcript_10046/g.13275 Transcript_10046/m.13275 type:complete len:352 (+) Transcript_10046:37-1092(+)